MMIKINVNAKTSQAKSVNKNKYNLSANVTSLLIDRYRLRISVGVIISC